MFLGMRKKYWLFLGATAVLIGLVCFAHLSPVFAWRLTETSGPGAAQLDKVIGSHPDAGKNLFRLDKKTLLGQCLKPADIDNVTLRLRLPDGLEAEANRFEPAVLVWTGRMFALDENCRTIPYDSAWGKINLPVLTGVKIGRFFEAPSDFRVAQVVSALKLAKDDWPDLYRRIAEIDFSDSVEIRIYLTTGLSEFAATGDNFAAQLVKLRAMCGLDEWSEAGRYNLQYDGVIIKER